MTDPETPTNSSDDCGPDCSCHSGHSRITRRDFILAATLAASGMAASSMPAIAGPFRSSELQEGIPEDKKLSAEWLKSLTERGSPTTYRGAELAKIGMPVGGICAGQL